MSSPHKANGNHTPAKAPPAPLNLYPVRTPAGNGWLGLDGERICWLSIGSFDKDAVAAYWKGPVHRPKNKPAAFPDLEGYAMGKVSLKVEPKGTAFQLRVWRELMSVPFAETVTYGALARRLGSPESARAVGSAVGANPVAWLIPCHRVLPANGGLGGYRWGTRAKERLLTWERSNQPETVPVRQIKNKHKLEALLLNAQRFEDLAKLAGSIAHDLNNLLAPIRMATELLKRKLEDRSLDRYLEIIEDSTGRARAVIQEILAFSRETESTDFQLVNVNELLAELAKTVRETFPETVKVRFVYDKSTPRVKIDPHQLYRAVLNLLLNSRDAVREKGNIQVRVGLQDFAIKICVGERCLIPGRYVSISVRDDGCGIPDDFHQKIFDPFFTTKSREKGTGLGLASVFGIVAQAGGFVDLDSAVGKGSTFYLYLPKAGK